MNCIICHKEVQQRSKRLRKICSSCSVARKRFRLKIKCVEYKGGKCELCGYNKSVKSLCFHHVDPTQKEFSISGNFALSWDRIQKELDKCQLLCHNCHGETHEQIEIDKNGDKQERWEQYQAEKTINIHKIKTLKQKASKFCSCCKKSVKYAYKSGMCSKCYHSQTKITWPTKEELEKMVWETPTQQLAKNLGVSDKAVEKRCKKYEIQKPPRGYWAKMKLCQKFG